MKNVLKTRILSFAWSIFLISSIHVACSPVNIHKVSVQKASSYEFSTTKAGLMVSVDPFFEEDRLKEFFGANLLSKGVLPVLVVFENVKAHDGFVDRPGQFSGGKARLQSRHNRFHIRKAGE